MAMAAVTAKATPLGGMTIPKRPAAYGGELHESQVALERYAAKSPLMSHRAAVREIERVLRDAWTAGELITSAWMKVQ